MRASYTAMQWSAVAAVSVAYLVGNSLPAITGALANDLRLSPGILGAFASAEYAGITAGILLSTILMRRSSPRGTVTTGLVILCLGDLGSAALGSTPWILIACRVIGAIGTGITVSICNYAFSLRERERWFAASEIGITATAALVLAIIGNLVPQFGWRMVFGLLALLTLPCIGLTPTFDTDYASDPPEEASGCSAPPKTMWLGFLAVVFFSMGQYALWTYLERIGVVAGMKDSVIDDILSGSMFFAMTGSGVAFVLAERVKSRIVILSCLFINLVGTAGTTAHPPWVFAGSVFAFSFSLPIYNAILFGVIMGRAKSKRFAAQFTLGMSFGSLGPAICGTVVENHGVDLAVWFEASLVLISGILLWVGFINPWIRSKDSLDTLNESAH